MKNLNSEIETIREKLKEFFSFHRDRPEDHTQKDINDVSFSARLLQISEFEFFQVAYFQWYGREIRESSLEYIFDDYMFKDIVPHYVRYFARKVLLLFDQGNLDPEEFNIERPKSTPELRSAGIGYTVMLIVILIIFCLLITNFTPYQ